ncbi:MAG: type II toxin-antitoxin system HicB family antitoxin [Anaerolineae bacterium]
MPSCQGVWATGKTLEECRRNLQEVLEGWIVIGKKLTAEAHSSRRNPENSLRSLRLGGKMTVEEAGRK